MMDYVTIVDDDYPTWLVEIDCPPVVLFYKGKLLFARYPGVAIVGTREMSTYGEQIVKGFVPAFAEAGIITISGLASGIDEAVHRETLAHKARRSVLLGQDLMLRIRVAGIVYKARWLTLVLLCRNICRGSDRLNINFRNVIALLPDCVRHA